MVWEVPAAIVGSQILSSYMGGEAAKEESERASAEANRLRQEALAELSNMEPMELAALGYDPEMIEYIKGPEPILYSPVADVQGEMVSTDPTTRAAQMAALDEITQRSEEGLSAADQYNFMKNRRDVETSARGQEQAIIENLKQRGMGGTGIEAAMRMMASQGGSDRLSEAQAYEAAQNADMRLGATQAKGQMAGNIRGQDINVAQSNADILNQLAWNNSERARQIANMNIDMKNQKAQADVAERRAVQGANVNAQNQAQLLNKQQDIDRERMRQESIRQQQISKAGALTGGIPDIYAQGAANAAADRQMWNTIGGAAGTAGQMYMTQQAANQSALQRDRDRALDRELLFKSGAVQPTTSTTRRGYNSGYATA